MLSVCVDDVFAVTNQYKVRSTTGVFGRMASPTVAVESTTTFLCRPENQKVVKSNIVADERIYLS